MIKTRDDLKKFLNYEKKKYGITDCLRYWIMLFCGSERAAIWRYQRSLRVTEYHYNMNHKVRCAISRIKLNHLSNKYGLHIGLNTCGRGLKRMHLGSVLINGNAQLGDDCSIHINTAIVAQGVNDSTPIIGRGVVIGVGAIIVGGVHIANNVAIGAGAVVVKDVQEENIAVAGVPARKVSDNGRLNWSNKKNETNTDS